MTDRRVHEQFLSASTARRPGMRKERRADQRTGDAGAPSNADMGAVPTREQAFEAFLALIAYATGKGATATLYDQKHLPPDCRSRDQYLRRHRELRRAGVEGAWMRGKTAACTSQAWSAKIARPRGDSCGPPIARNIDDELDAALGIKTNLKLR